MTTLDAISNLDLRIAFLIAAIREYVRTMELPVNLDDIEKLSPEDLTAVVGFLRDLSRSIQRV